MNSAQLFVERGPWTQTISGGHWFPFSPRVDDVRLADIRAISRVSRFGGHTTVAPYTVAEHCCRVARAMQEAGHDADTVLAGLIHDAHEAYPPGDVAAPCKRRWHEGTWGHAFAEAVREVEKQAATCVRIALMGIDRYKRHEEAVRHFDLVLLATERRDLMAASDVDWSALPEPLPAPIWPWSIGFAWEAWIGMYRELGGRAS